MKTPTDEPGATPCSLTQLLIYFLRLGALGFGGPIALAGYMQRDLVEERHWISRQDYLEGLALAQLAPGPLAAQLAIYLGYIRAGTLGATLVGIAFVGPSLLMVMGIAAIYIRYGGLPWMQSVFYGIGAAVIAIIARSAVKLTSMTLRHEKLLWMIFAVVAVTTATTGREIVWLLLLAGLVAYLRRAILDRKHLRTAASCLALPPFFRFVLQSKSMQLLWFFAKAGTFVFGSGLAIVPFLYGGVVQQHHWLNDRQFLDAVAVAMITPGPVVITSGFIGFLVDGPIGALTAAAGVFVPVYLVVVLASPYFSRIARNPEWRAPLEGITAAATGAIAGAVVVLGRRSVHDAPTIAIFAAALLLLVRWKIREPVVIMLAGLAGVLAFPRGYF